MSGCERCSVVFDEESYRHYIYNAHYASIIKSRVEMWLDGYRKYRSDLSFSMVNSDFSDIDFAALHSYIPRASVATVLLLEQLNILIKDCEREYPLEDAFKIIDICETMHGYFHRFLDMIAIFDNYDNFSRMIKSDAKELEIEIIEAIKNQSYILCAQAVIVYKAKAEVRSEELMCAKKAEDGGVIE